MTYKSDISNADRQQFSAVDFRKAMSHFVTGVAVVTASEEAARFGMTVNSLTSVSLDPCLLLVCPRKGSATGEVIKRTGRFAVNILSAEQQELCMRFVGENAARFDGLEGIEDVEGIPLLPDSLVHFVCTLEAVHAGGDHDILVGRVVDGKVAPGEPLIFHKGTLCRRSTEEKEWN